VFDVLNNRISIPVKTTKFTSKVNDIVYFNGPQSVGVGTTSGGAINVDRVTGEIKETVSIPTRTIHVPNHPFKTGQKLTLNKRNGANRFDVGSTPLVTEFKLPFLGANSTDVYVINKGEDNIGLVTSRVGTATTSEGLYFYSKGSTSGISSGLYFFQTNNTQVTGDVDKIVTKVSTNVSAANTTTHNLVEGDTIRMNVVPNLNVGIGTTVAVSVNYNSEFEKLIVDPISFTASDVEANQIDLVNHGFKTGDKVFYDGGATGLSTGTATVVPIPTLRLGTTFILIVSPSTRLCVVVFAADTFVDTLVTILSTSPVTCVLLVWKKYNPEEIPEVEPLL
jgi:hypothetical protein